MDIAVRYWDNEVDEIQCSYFTSTFIEGRATAENLKNHFKDAIKSVLKDERILQISMDGPNVNWKFLDLFTEDGDCNLLDLGSCGLHVIHGALQTGHKATDWNVDATLRGLYWIFKDSPARRADFIKITGTQKFPLKFCQTRWVEGKTAAQRALEIFRNACEFVRNKNVKLPSTTSVNNVNRACDDKLTLCKISFFERMASILEVFLVKYQSKKPLAPFLYGDIKNVLLSLLNIIMKKEAIPKDPNTFSKIDFENKKNFVDYKQALLGFATKKYLKDCNASEKDKIIFLQEVRTFVVATVQKILQKSPLKRKVVEAISCLDPAVISSNVREALSRMQLLLEILFDADKISSNMAENCSTQFTIFCETEIDLIKVYNNEDQRLDSFYKTIMESKMNNYKYLWEVCKIVFVLSHGNAFVESGFSINKDMLIENMHERTLVAQRTVYNAINLAGGPLNIPLLKELISSCLLASGRYKAALSSASSQSDDTRVKSQASKKRVYEEINLLEAKRQKITDDSNIKNLEISKKIESLRKKV